MVRPFVLNVSKLLRYSKVYSPLVSLQVLLT